MDMLDRLGRLLRSFVPDEEAPFDPDLSDAWEELDGYLGEERHAFRKPPRRDDESAPLASEYRVLELEPGSSMEEVRGSYKRLLRKYHPDRFLGKPEKQRAATEVTQAVIAAYRTIRSAKE